MLVIFVVAVSVCLTVGLIINYLTLKSSTQKFFSQSNLPNLWIETTKITDEDELFLSSRFEYDKRYRFESDFNVGNNSYRGTFLVSGGEVSTPYLFGENIGHGCYVDAKFAQEHRFGIDFSKVAFDFEINGVEYPIEFKVVDFIAFAEDFIADGDAIIFIDEDYFLENLKRSIDGLDDADLSIIEYNEILITSDVSEEDISDIRGHFDSSASEIVTIKNLEDNESINTINFELETAKKMVVIFPLIFVLSSILVVVSAISQLVLKERYNIGLLKSLGIRNKQIISNYCGYGTTICFIGAVIGLLLSPVIIPNMTFEIYDQLYNLPRDIVRIVFPIELIILVIFSAILIGYFSALFVIANLVKKTPKECMSKFSRTTLKSRKKRIRLPVIIGAPLRNMKSNLTRTIMSVFGIAGSSLLMMIGFSVESLLEAKAWNSEYLTINVFSNIFKGFSIVLLVLTVVALIIQIFKERIKEMAVLRIHGEGYIKIWLSVLMEMIFVGIVGYLISVLLSGPTMLLNLHMFGFNEYFAIDFLSYFKAFLFIFLTIVLVAGFGIIKIYKLRLSEAIKFSE